MWANSVFEALGCPFWPSPPAPLPKWERGDSGVRVWHPIAVHGHDEQLFGPPLNPKWRGDSGARLGHPIAVHGHDEQLFGPPLNHRAQVFAPTLGLFRRLFK
jgi:hypothetical protein